MYCVCMANVDQNFHTASRNYHKKTDDCTYSNVMENDLIVTDDSATNGVVEEVIHKVTWIEILGEKININA